MRELPGNLVHFTWDATHEPALAIESGDTVVVETRDVSDNQISPDSTAAALTTIDWERLYPLAGPISVAGAEPGDTLAVDGYDLSAEDAYVLSSLCVDLKISEIVDAGQFVVSAVLPLAIFG